MYIWSISGLCQSLQKGTISAFDTLFYLIANVFFFCLGLSIFIWLPILYRFTLNIIKNYLEKKADPAQLFIVVYDYTHSWLFFGTISIIALGLIGCYQANKDNKDFLKRIICLSWLINIRLMMILTLIFSATIACFAAIYIPKLMMLASKPLDTSNPIGLVFGLAKRLTVVGPVVGKLINLQKAAVIFTQINKISLYLYYACGMITILGTGWFFVRIRSCIQNIVNSK